MSKPRLTADGVVYAAPEPAAAEPQPPPPMQFIDNNMSAFRDSGADQHTLIFEARSVALLSEEAFQLLRNELATTFPYHRIVLLLHGLQYAGSVPGVPNREAQ